MNTNDKEFEKRLINTFRNEAAEHLHAIAKGLIKLEQATEDQAVEMIESIFREIHSLKGAARSVGQKEMESLCQLMESIFSALKRREIKMQTDLFDLFHDSVNVLKQLLNQPQNGFATTARSEVRRLSKKLTAAAKGDMPVRGSGSAGTTGSTEVEKHQPVDEPKIPPSSVRIQTNKLDPLLLQAEEMIQTKSASSQRISELGEMENMLATFRTELSLWRSRKNLEKYPQGREFLSWVEGQLYKLETLTDTTSRSLMNDHHTVTRLVDDHLEGMKRLLLMPVAILVESFPKFIRDLAHDQEKEVNLVMQGTELEIDKRILDELKDPLIHILRNCIDHGIQSPRDRLASRKPKQGTISLTLTTGENQLLEIVISDDGKGIDLEKVRAKAIKMGLIQQELYPALTDQEVREFIFHSGISTSDIITDLSGRGLGLAIVREKIEKSGGTVTVESNQGTGTTFRIIVPLTISMFRGILLRSGDHQFMIPTLNVIRIIRINPEQIKTMENKETISVNDQLLPVVRLPDILGLPEPNKPSDGLSAENADAENADYVKLVIIESGNHRIAFQVDEVLSEQQFLLKGLGKQLRRVRNIAGATVLGTGRVVPVLNVSDLVKSALQPVSSSQTHFVEKKEKPIQKILVAEDSITSRILLKNILETAGYFVSTAIDGMDAYMQTKEGGFDLLVSDVDMPRMNGFELTRKIRGEKRFADLPVVLVTALDSREDREQGIEAGANAYMIKSKFDQSNLLEVIRKLI